MRRLFVVGASVLTAVVTIVGNSGIVHALPAARSYTSEAYGDVFLGGEYIELGISSLGSFGTTEYIPETEDLVALPEGFYGTAERGAVGMSTNPAGFGEEPDLRMDFFMPGTPEERWSVGYMSGGDTFRGSNSLLNPVDPEDEDLEVIPDVVTDTTVTDMSSGDTLAARTVGNYNSTLRTTQNISFHKSDKFFKNVVTLKNISGAAIDSVRFMRSFDPDNTVDQGADYTTHNFVTKTIADGDGAAMVVADTNIPDADPTDPVYLINGSRSPIFYYSSDSRAKVYSWGFDNSDVYAPEVYDEAPAKGFEIIDDIAIGITFDVGTLAANQEATFTYYTSLDNRDIEEVLTDIAADDEPDADLDKVSDAIEAAGPNSGDANGDGIADSTQPTVTAIPNTVVGGSAYMALEMTGDCSVITGLEVKAEAVVSNDGAYNYPLGLADFTSSCTTPGGTSTIKIYYDKEYDTTNWAIRKFMNGAYQNVPGAVIGSAMVGSTKVTTLTYSVTDGGALDADGAANGIIVDPAGPAVLAVTSPDTGIESVNAVMVFAPIFVGAGLLVVGLQKRRSPSNAKLS